MKEGFLCELLRDKLSDVIDFKRPDGGLASGKIDKSVPLPELNVRMKAKGTYYLQWLINNTGKFY
jgi:GntR family transcriptional regulator/MocR family aminotransferase